MGVFIAWAAAAKRRAAAIAAAATPPDPPRPAPPPPPAASASASASPLRPSPSARLSTVGAMAAGEPPPLMVAAFAACAVVRSAGAMAYGKRRRSMLAGDVIEELGAAMERLFPTPGQL